MKNKGLGKPIIVIILVAVVAVGGIAAYMTLSGNGGGAHVNDEDEDINGLDDTDEIEVSNLTLAEDMTENYKPIDETTVFSENDDVYLIGDINNPEVGMEIYTNWYDEDGKLVYTFENESLVLSEAHINGTTNMYFMIGPPTVTWTPGSYSVELVIDDESIETLDFEIVADE